MYKILLVEDDYEMRSNIKRYLELNNFTVFDAENGKEGAELAAIKQPDLIVSDISMPVLDGFEMLALLQKNISTATIPFLFLSARSDKSDVREGMKLGANDFLSKPFSFSELIDVINVQLKKKELEKKQSEDRIEQLRENIRLAIPHELRTPLNSILGISSILAKSEEFSEDTKEMVQMLNESAQRLHSTLEKYNRYVYVELITSDYAEINYLQSKITNAAQYIIEEIAYSYAEKFNRTKDLKFDLCSADLKISEEHFALLLEELLHNAFKFSLEGKEIAINSKNSNNIFSLTIKNTGQGFPKDALEQIGTFVQFDRKKYEQQGIGLGLIIVKRIISIYKGSLDIESDEKSYTAVTISLPLIEG